MWFPVLLNFDIRMEMKNGSVIKLLAAACLAIFASAGCTPDRREAENSVGGVPIRIVAEINTDTKASAMPGKAIGLRSVGEWHEDYVVAEEYEKSINNVLLFAYKDAETVPKKVIFYYPQGETNPLDGISIDRFESRTMGNAAASGSRIELDLELMEGYYNFVLIVNSGSALKKLKNEHQLPEPKEMVDKTEIFTSDDLQGSSRKYLPMTGQQSFRVPVNTGSGNRVTLAPEIALERTHARIEFILTTVDAGGNLLSPSLQQAKITNLTIKNELGGYSVLPSAGEYTATGGKNPSLRGAAYSAVPRYLPERAGFHAGANEGTGAGEHVAKCNKRLLPYSGGQAKYIYVAPGIYEKNSTGVPALELSVDFRSGEPEKKYEIELYNPDIDESETGYNNIRRNTVYRIFATLKGPKNMEFDIVVNNWEDVQVAIPW